MMVAPVGNKKELYFRVREAYKKSHTNQTDQMNHENSIKIWNDMKKAHNLSDVVAKFEEEQAKVSLKKKGQLLGFWSSLSHKPAEENTTQGQELSTADGIERCIHNAVYVEESSGTSTGNGSTSSENPALNPASSSTSANIVKPAKRARAQEELQEKIAVLQNDLVGLYHRKSKDMLSSEQSMELKQKQKQVTDLKKKSTCQRAGC